MHPQLVAIITDFQEASRRIERLDSTYTDQDWSSRPAATSWSAAECVQHINLTSAAYIGLLTEALREARELQRPPPRRYRRDPIGWLIWRSTRPGSRMRVKTTPAFVPMGGDDKATLMAEFERLQREQIAFVEGSEGLPIHRVRMATPFAKRVRYSLYSGLTILTAHQHRHLAQAEGALELSRVNSG